MAHSVRRRLLAPVLGAGLLLGAAVTPAAAMTQISLTGCANAGGGEQHISADFVYLKAGWIAKTKGQILAFQRSITWNVTVDGAPVDVTPFIVDPAKTADGWALWFYLPAGQLAFGDTMTASVEYFLNRPVYDGYDTFPAGSLFTSECTIYADVS